MHEILKDQPTLNLTNKIDYLLDTCFLVYIFQNQLEKKLTILLKNHKCAITSFNLEEFQHIKVPAKVKQEAKKFFKHHEISILKLPVSPGSFENEKTFVKSIIPDLDEQEHDMSDAVLIAAGIKTRANILTRDKHDIFNTRLENYLQEFNIKVENKFPS